MLLVLIVERVSAARRCVLLVLCWGWRGKGEGGRKGTYSKAVVALAATCSATAGEVGGLFGGEIVCHCFCKCLVVHRMFLTLMIMLEER